MRVVSAVLLCGLGFWIATLASYLVARQIGFIPCCIEDAETWGTVDGLRRAGVLGLLYGLAYELAFGGVYFGVCLLVTRKLTPTAAFVWGGLVAVWWAAMFYPGQGMLFLGDAIYSSIVGPNVDRLSAVSLTLGYIYLGLLLVGVPHAFGWGLSRAFSALQPHAK